MLDYDTFFETTDLILANNIPQLLLLFNNTLSNGFDGHHFISGLTSHFRDLMVCSQPETVALLEVGEDAKAKYIEQAKNVTKEFLVKAIDLANEADLKYKGSRNQRLLVELTLMKLASLTYTSEKKKDEFIIPATHFRSNDFQKAPEPSYSITETISTKSPPEPPPTTTATEVVEPPKKELGNTITLKSSSKRVSGLSLSSLKAKKEHEAVKNPVEEKELPTEEFTETDLLTHWNAYIKKLEKQGKKILASNLQTDTPKLEGTTILLEFPNGTMKKEVEREQGPLLQYLKDELKNHLISLKVHVNEESAKKYAFTPEEKYEKLKEKNPAIELLRKEFDLDF